MKTLWPMAEKRDQIENVLCCIMYEFVAVFCALLLASFWGFGGCEGFCLYGGERDRSVCVCSVLGVFNCIDV